MAEDQRPLEFKTNGPDIAPVGHKKNYRKCVLKNGTVRKVRKIIRIIINTVADNRCNLYL